MTMLTEPTTRTLEVLGGEHGQTGEPAAFAATLRQVLEEDGSMDLEAE